MALFDNATFAPQTFQGGNGGLLGSILAMLQANPQASQGFPQADPAQLPVNAQPTQGQMPQQMRPQYPAMPEPSVQQRPQMQQPSMGGGMGSMGGDFMSALMPGRMRAMRDAQLPQQAEQMLAGMGMNPMMRSVIANNPTLLAAVMAKSLGLKDPERTIVPAGSTVLGPGNVPIYTAPKEHNKSELEKRADDAGLQPGSQERKDFMLRGGKNADAPLSATDKKALFAAEDEIPQTKGTIDALNRALELNDKAFSGFGASTLGTIGNKIPGGSLFVDADKARATQEWEKIMAPEALKTMADTLKGATTDFELKKFIEMLGDPATDPAIRKSIIQRLKLLAERKLELQSSRVNELRGGTYFKPGGGGSAAPGAASAAPQNYIWDGTKLVPQ